MRRYLLFPLIFLCLSLAAQAAEVVLKWDAYTEAADHLELQRCPVPVDASGNPTAVPAAWVTVSSIDPTDVTFTDQVEPGGYYWRLRAVTASGVESKWSNWTFKAIEIGEPSGLTAN